MNGTVVYQSFWGSCKRIAEAITEGINSTGHEVRAVAVENIGTPEPSTGFVVVGAASRWPGAPRKIKRFANDLAEAGFAGKPFATFSTGGTVFDEEPNRQAAEVLAEILEAGGLVPLTNPFIAGIEGFKSWGRAKGSLPENEVDRAREYGRVLGTLLSSREG